MRFKLFLFLCLSSLFPSLSCTKNLKVLYGHTTPFSLYPLSIKGKSVSRGGEGVYVGSRNRGLDFYLFSQWKPKELLTYVQTFIRSRKLQSWNGGVGGVLRCNLLVQKSLPQDLIVVRKLF